MPESVFGGSNQQSPVFCSGDVLSDEHYRIAKFCRQFLPCFVENVPEDNSS
ncbi:hypothetical protein JOE66_003256 [Subtercola frigoramans]|uniref:Uncharacterized protein n=1 Tax=Subtercola frigoramans TaxID=120298 RepID=A0ABS2L961_9MICO|nr:hypothetical protein [Subtercola frigoramans]